MSKHDKTLAAIFTDPVRSNITWTSVEALFVSLRASVSEGSGSRVRVFHRPHPRKELLKAAVKDVREFLELAGVS